MAPVSYKDSSLKRLFLFQVFLSPHTIQGNIIHFQQGEREHCFDYTNWRLTICLWRLYQYFSSWSPKGNVMIFSISSPVSGTFKSICYDQIVMTFISYLLWCFWMAYVMFKSKYLMLVLKKWKKWFIASFLQLSRKLGLTTWHAGKKSMKVLSKDARLFSSGTWQLEEQKIQKKDPAHRSSRSRKKKQAQVKHASAHQMMRTQ